MSEYFNISEFSERMQGNAVEYLEFLGLPSLNCGIYHLEIGAEDTQAPHETDEVYYVLQGSANFEGLEMTCKVQPGSLIFVPAHEPHKFTDIHENLQLLVIFSGAEAEAEAMGVEEIDM